jgi:hypothetical protein
MLHLTPFGLGGPSFAVTLGAVVIAWTAIAIRRRREAPVAPTAAPAETRPVWALGPPVAARLVLAVAAGLTLAAVGLSVWGARHAGQATFTQLWAMPTADEHSIRIGVENFEGRTMTYALELRAEDEVVRVWPSLLVLPEQPWEDTVPVPVTARSVDVVLVRSDLPAEVYRAVRIWPQGSASSTPRL